MAQSAGAVIQGIIAQFPEMEWLARSRLALPDCTDGEILSIIEFLCGGDVLAIDESTQLDD